MILSEGAGFDLAVGLRTDGASIGAVFSFISSLYFRGKLAYAQAFAKPPGKVPGTLVITAARGLLTPETSLTLADLQTLASVPIDAAERRYRDPLERDASTLAQSVGPDCEIVLLGSIATEKYVEPLLNIFRDRLLFPIDFAGRGDMSRGGLMLRAANSGVELAYASVSGANRHGARPPKLPKLPRIR
jgi:hypothetical protein